MEEELIKKLDKDINCDLSIEEIKLLYSVDIFDNKELYKLRGKRNKEYEDLCKIYNSNLIACTCMLNENMLLTGDYNGLIKQWKIEGDNLNLVSTKESAQKNSIYSLIKIGDGHIASGSSDKSIKIW